MSKPKNEEELPDLRVVYLVAERSQLIPSFEKNIVNVKEFSPIELVSFSQYKSFVDDKEKEAKRIKPKGTDVNEVSAPVNYLRLFFDFLKERVQNNSLKHNKELNKGKKKDEESHGHVPLSEYFDHVFVLLEFQTEIANMDLTFIEPNIHFSCLNVIHVMIEGANIKGLSYKDVLGIEAIDKIKGQESKAEALRQSHMEMVKKSNLHSKIRNSLFYEINFEHIESADKNLIAQGIELLHKLILQYLNSYEKRLFSYYSWIKTIKLKSYKFPERKVRNFKSYQTQLDGLFASSRSDQYFSSDLLKSMANSIENTFDTKGESSEREIQEIGEETNELSSNQDLTILLSDMYFKKLSSLYDSDLKIKSLSKKSALEIQKKILLHTETLQLTPEHVCQKMNLFDNKPEQFEECYFNEKISQEEYYHRSFGLLQKKMSKTIMDNQFDNSKFIVYSYPSQGNDINREDWGTDTLLIPHAYLWLANQSVYSKCESFVDFDIYKLFKWDNNYQKISMSDDVKMVSRQTDVNNISNIHLSLHKNHSYNIYIKKAMTLSTDFNIVEKKERLDSAKQSELTEKYIKFLESRKKIQKGAKINHEEFGPYEDMLYMEYFNFVEKGDCVELKFDKNVNIYLGKEVYYKTSPSEHDSKYLLGFLYNKFDAQKTAALGYAITYKMSEKVFLKVFPDGNLYVLCLEDSACMGKLYFKNGCVAEYRFKHINGRPVTLTEVQEILKSGSENKENRENIQLAIMEHINIVVKYPSGCYRIFDGKKTTIVNENNQCFSVEETTGITENQMLYSVKRSALPTTKYPNCVTRNDGYKVINLDDHNTVYIHPNNLQVITKSTTESIELQEKYYPTIKIRPFSYEDRSHLIPDSRSHLYEEKYFDITDTNTNTNLLIFKRVDIPDNFEVALKTSREDLIYFSNEGRVVTVPSSLLENFDGYISRKQVKQKILETFIVSIQALAYYTKKVQAKFSKIKKPKKKDQEKFDKMIQEKVDELLGVIHAVLSDSVMAKQNSRDNKISTAKLHDILLGNEVTYETILIDLNSRVIQSHDCLDRQIEVGFDNTIKLPKFNYQSVYEILADRIEPMTQISDTASSRTTVEPPSFDELSSYYDKYFGLLNFNNDREKLFWITDKQICELINRGEFGERHKLHSLMTHNILGDGKKSIKYIEANETDKRKSSRNNDLFSIKISNPIDVLTYNNIVDLEANIISPKKMSENYYYIRYMDLYKLEEFKALVKQIEVYMNQVQKSNTFYAFETTLEKTGGNLLTKSQRVRIIENLSENETIDSCHIMEIINCLNSTVSENILNDYYDRGQQQLLEELENQGLRVQTEESADTSEMNPFYELNDDESRVLRRKKEEKQLKLLCSKFVSNYFQTYHGSMYALKNPKRSNKNILSTEDKKIIEELLRASGEGHKENLENNKDSRFEHLDQNGHKNIESEYLATNENKDLQKNKSQKFKIKTKSIHKQSLEATRFFKEKGLAKEQQLRDMKTNKFNNIGQVRDSIEVSGIFKRKNRPESKNIENIERDAEVDKRVRTSSMSRKMYLSAQSIQDVRTNSKHKLLLQAQDTAFPVDFMQYKAKLMPTYVFNDKSYKDITIYPHVINFGSIKAKSYYETKFYIINDESLMQKVSIKPPLESQNVFIIYEQGSTAPGMKKEVKVQLDTIHLKAGFYKRTIKIKTKYMTYDLPVVAFIETEINKDLILSSGFELVENPYKVIKLQKLPEDTQIYTQVGKTQGVTSLNIPKLSYDANFNLMLTKQEHTQNGDSSSMP